MIVGSFVFASAPRVTCAPRRFRSSPASRRGAAAPSVSPSASTSRDALHPLDIEIVFLYPLAVICICWVVGFFEFLTFLIICSWPTSISGGGRSRMAVATTARNGRLRDHGLQSSGGCADEGRASSRRGERPREERRLTTLQKAVAWPRTNSMWPDTSASRAARSMICRSSPAATTSRGSDGAVPRLARQADPADRLRARSTRWRRRCGRSRPDAGAQVVIAMGACASSGGMSTLRIVQSVDNRPVDITSPAARRGPSS